MYYDSIIVIILNLRSEKRRELCFQVLDFISATEATHDNIKMFFALIFDSGTDWETATHAQALFPVNEEGVHLDLQICLQVGTCLQQLLVLCLCFL